MLRYFGDFLLKSAIFPDISHGQRRSTKVKRTTVPPLPLIWGRGDLNPKPNLPSGLTSPLLYNVQKIYIYLNSLYKKKY